MLMAALNCKLSHAHDSVLYYADVHLLHGAAVEGRLWPSCGKCQQTMSL